MLVPCVFLCSDGGVIAAGGVLGYPPPLFRLVVDPVEMLLQHPVVN